MRWTGRVDGIATAPVNKLGFSRAGLPWKGHTDLLAALTHSPLAAMMFWSEPLKVVLATVHVPLADVPRLLTRELVGDIIDLTARELPRFGIDAAAARACRIESACRRGRASRP